MGGSSCFLLPHGGYALLPTVLTTMAWVASIFQDGCDYAIIEGSVVQTLLTSIDEDDTSTPWVEVGFAGFRKPEYNLQKDVWEITYAGSCSKYDTDRIEFDPAWKASKAFAFLALVLGGGGALFLWFSACCVFSKATWRWAGYEVLLAAVFQAMAFMWYGNSLCRYHNNTCTMSWGTKADVVALVFWGLAALAIFAKYPPPQYGGTSDRSRVTTATTTASIGTITTTTPEIVVTGLEGAPVTAADSAKRKPKISFYANSSQVAAALPLEGDATASMPSVSTSPKRSRKNQVSGYDQISNNSGGKQLKDAEVL